MPGTKDGGKIKFGVQFDVQKSSLNEITKALKGVQDAATANKGSGLQAQFNQAAEAARKLESIVSGSWNHKLDQLNLNKFNKSIKESFGDVKQLKAQLTASGPAGQAAFNSVAHSVLNTNVQLRQSNTLLDSMATSMKNTIKWGITASIFNRITGSIQQAFYYAKDLNLSLTDIRMVTGASADEMQRFAKNANQVSQNLARSTLDYTKAAVGFYRQGLGDEDVAQRTELTLKAQNVTGAGQEMADYLTSVWNGFKATNEQAEHFGDAMAKVADSSASDMSEIATAMSKVAATAETVGVGFDQLNAQIATVVAATRLAPESVGTAFKTMFARINDIKTGADEAEISLGNYSGRMAQLGFNVLDASGNLRDTGQVIEEIGGKWNTLTKEQQTYLASTMGGQRQITQVMALFNNWDKYVELLNTSLEANGTLNEKNNIYLESTKGHIQQLNTEFERLNASLADTDVINGLVDTLKSGLSIFTDFIEGIGGGTKAFAYFGSLVVGIFSKQISQSIVQATQRLKDFINTRNMSKFQNQYASAIAEKNGVDYFQTDATTVQQDAIIAKAKQQASVYTETLTARRGLTLEQQKGLTQAQEEIGKLTEQKYLLEHIEDIRRQYGIQHLTDLQSLQEEQQSLKRQDASLSSQLSMLDQIQHFLQKDVLSMEQAAKYQQIMRQLQKDGVITWQQRMALMQGDKNAEQIIQSLIEKHTITYKDIHGELQQITSVKQLQQALDSGQLKIIDGQLVATGKLVENYKKIGETNVVVQRVIKGFSAVGMALSSLTGAFETFGKQSATAAQKANAAFSGLQGTISAVGMATGPWGMAISTLVNGAISLVKSIFGQQIEQLFMTIDQKMQKYQKKAQDAIEAGGKKAKDISSLKQIQQEYDKLSAKAGEYGRNIDNLTEEEKNRYHEITNQFAEYNKAVVVGYDEQGNAIVKNNSALSQTIALLEELQGKAVLDALGGSAEKYVERTQANANEYRQSAQNDIDQHFNGIAPSYLKEFMNTVAENDSSELLSFTEGWQDPTVSLRTILQGLNIDEEQLEQTVVEWNGNRLNALNVLETAFQELGRSDISPDIAQNYYSLLSETFSVLKDNFASGNEELSNTLDSIISGIQGISLPKTIQDLQNAVSEGMLLPTEELAVVLKYGEDQFSKNYKALAETTFFDDSIESLLYEKMSGWHVGAQGEQVAIDDETGYKSGGLNEIINYINEYIASLTQVGNKLKQAGTEIPETIDDIQGSSLQEKINNIPNILINIIKDIDIDKDAIPAALEYLLNEMGLTGEIVLDASGNWTVDPDSIKTGTDALLENTQKQIQKQLKSGSVQNLAGFENLFTLDFKNMVDSDTELTELLNAVSEINWADFWARVNQLISKEGYSGNPINDVFRQMIQEAQTTVESSPLDFFDSFLNTDSLTDKLEKSKDLGDDDLAYLQELATLFPELDAIQQRTWMGSPQYIKYLKSVQDNMGQILKDTIATKKAEKQTEVERNKNLLKFYGLSEKSSKEELEKVADGNEFFLSNLQNSQSIIISGQQEIISLKYQEHQIDYENAEYLKQQTQNRKKQEEEILNLQKQQTQASINNINNLSTAIEHLKDPTADVTKEDYSAIYQWITDHPELAELAGEDYANLFDKGFINALENSYNSGKDNALSGYFSDTVTQIEEAIERKKAELEELNKPVISESEAKSLKQSGAPSSVIDQYEVKTDNQLLELEIKRETASQELNQLQIDLVEAKHQENEQNRIALASGEALLNIYTNLADKVASQERFGPDLQGDELIRWEATLDRVAEKYPQLETQANYLKDTWLSGTTEYREALRQVKDALQQLERSELESDENVIADKLQEQLEKVKDEQLTLDIDIDPQAWESFVNDVEDFCDIEHDIIVSIHSDAEDAFDSLKDQMDEVYEAASKIGEGYKIAADDVREVNNVFPGILENAQVLHDGTVQLNQDAVQQAIAGAADTAAADAESVNQQLQSQANLLRTKAINYQQAAKLARQLASGELQVENLTAEQRSTLFETFANAKQDMSNQAATQEEKDLNAVGTTASQVGGDMANSMAQAATSVVGSFAQMTNKAIANLRMIAAGVQAVKHGGMPSGSGIAGAVGSTYSGGQTSDHSNVKGTTGVTNQYSGSSGRVKDVDVQGNVVDHSLEALVNEQDWNDIADMFDQLAADANSAANDIQGMMVGNAAMTQNLASGLGNVVAGRGASPKSSGGGGGGGGGNAKDPDLMEYLEDQADRYHDVDIKIKQLTDDLEELQDLQEKLYGQDLIDNLNDQLGLLEAQNKAYQKKIDIAKEEAAELRGKLATDQVAFDAEGNIINYASALGAKLQWVNNTIEYYNSLTAQEQEAYKDTVEAAKQEYEEMKKTIERYDEVTTEMIPELAKNIRENLDKQVEIKISRFKMTVDIRLDLSQAERDWNKFRKEVIDMIRDDDVLGDMKAELRDFASYYNGAGTAAVQDLTRQVSATLGQLYQMDAGQLASSYGNNRAQALEDLKKYTDDLMNNLEDVEQLIKDIKDHIFDAIDNVQDAMDEQIDNFEFISKLIDHDRKTIELMYGKDAYQSLAKYYALQEQNNNKQLDFLRKEKDYWQANMLTEQAAMQQMTLGSNEWAEAKKRFDAYKENWMKAVEDLNDLTESAIQNIIDKYANAIDETMSNLEKKLSNGKGYDYVKEEWQLINKEADLYYDHIDRMYETNKFEQAVKDAINANQGNIKAQKSLNDLLEEQLKYLNDKEKLTKYDIDRANALLQIEIKRLALEDARNNKTKLRLRRDSQGNYTYQYTADQGDVDNARQGLADAQNDLWQLDKDTNANWLEQFYQNQVDVQQRIKEIYKDVTLTKQQQDEQAALVYAYYQQIQDDLLKEHTGLRELMMNDAFDIYSDLYDKNVEDFRNMTEAEKSLFMEDLVPTWNSGVQQMMDIMAGEGGFLPTTQDSMEELKDLTQDYQDSLDELAAAAGADFGDIQDGTDDVIDITEDLLDMNQQVIDSYMDELEAVKQVMEYVKQLSIAYGVAKQAAIDAATESYNYWMKEQQIAAERAEAEAKANQVEERPFEIPETWVAPVVPVQWTAPASTASTAPSGSYSPSSSSSSTSGTKDYNIWKSSKPLDTSTDTRPYSTPNFDYQIIDIRNGSKKGGVRRYDTGGYTGEWDSSPKLALLDQKELVLNAEDTENILNAVDIVRGMNDWLSSMYEGINIPSGFRGAEASQNTTIDQNVHITAQFPNVSDHTEIERALETLVNRASQFAFNTTR